MSADGDPGRVAHRRATLTIVTAAVPTTVMSATRNTAGSMWPSSFRPETRLRCLTERAYAARAQDSFLQSMRRGSVKRLLGGNPRATLTTVIEPLGKSDAWLVPPRLCGRGR